MAKKKKINKVLIPIIACSVFLFYILFFELFLNNAINIYLYKSLDIQEKSREDFINLLEKKIIDFFMFIESFVNSNISFNINYTQRNLSKNVSNDIMIVAIDEKSLNNIGRWPFNRIVHSKLVDNFTRLKHRENTILFDVFFLEPDMNNPESDAIFINSIKKNDRVVVDYIARDSDYASIEEKNEMNERFKFAEQKFGSIKNIKVNIKSANSFLGLTPPLIPYIDSIKSMGYANVIEDMDKIIRKYPLISRYLEKEEITFSELKPDYYADNIYLATYTIQKSNSDNYYYLVKYEPKIFSQESKEYYLRKGLNSNDIDTIKAKMDKSIKDFELELQKLKSKIEMENQKIITKINKYLEKSEMPDDFKAQIKDVFNNKENIKDTDIFLKDLANNFALLSEKDKRFKKDALFFMSLYKEAIKVDREGVIVKNKKINLYDFLYSKESIYTEDLICRKEKFIPSIPLVLICRYYNVDFSNIEVIFGKEIILHNPKIRNKDTGALEDLVIKNKKLDKIKIPINQNGFMDIFYAGKGSSPIRTERTTFDTYSYYDFLDKNKSIYVKDKIVLIGAFSSGMADDMYQTPFQTMFGIEIIANTINTVMMNKYIKKIPFILYYLLILIMAIFVAFIASNKNIFRAYIYSILFIFVYFVFSAIIFSNSNIVLPTIRVIIVSLLSFMSIIVYRVLTEEKQKKEIKNIFSKYVNPNVVEQLLLNPPELGGVDMDITVQFSDIRGFTTLSEALTPQELVALLNRYLTAMTDIIMEYNGTLDKYIGDAIMCFWGAPNPIENHAELACRAALKQLEKLKEINETLPEGKKINIGIGLNTGIMTAGNMGSEGRMNYTLMGDNVNLGSRLEGINKYYGTNIIVSEYTYERVKDKFIFRELDRIRVKGKTLPVSIYELIAEKDEAITDE